MDDYKKLQNKLESVDDTLSDRLELETGILEWHEEKLQECTEEISEIEEKIAVKKDELELYNAFDLKAIIKKLTTFDLIYLVVILLIFFEEILAGSFLFPLLILVTITATEACHEFKNNESIKVRRKYTDNYLKAIIEMHEKSLSEAKIREHNLTNSINVYKDTIDKLTANQELVTQILDVVSEKRDVALENLATSNEELLNRNFIEDRNAGVFRLERVKKDNE